MLFGSQYVVGTVSGEYRYVQKRRKVVNVNWLGKKKKQEEQNEGYKDLVLLVDYQISFPLSVFQSRGRGTPSRPALS